MRITGYSIELNRLEERHLPSVLEWRNADFVRSRMQHRESIEWQDHLHWFRGLDPENDWYFVASAEEEPFGVFHIKNIDRNAGSGEAGAFVGVPETMESFLPALAILLLMEFAFGELELELLEAKYHPDFPAIARLNEQMGYEIVSMETQGFVRARVTKARFLECAGKFVKAAKKWAELRED